LILNKFIKLEALINIDKDNYLTMIK